MGMTWQCRASYHRFICSHLLYFLTHTHLLLLFFFATSPAGQQHAKHTSITGIASWRGLGRAAFFSLPVSSCCCFCKPPFLRLDAAPLPCPSAAWAAEFLCLVHAVVYAGCRNTWDDAYTTFMDEQNNTASVMPGLSMTYTSEPDTYLAHLPSTTQQRLLHHPPLTRTRNLLPTNNSTYERVTAGDLCQGRRTVLNTNSSERWRDGWRQQERFLSFM